jgi:hypothetical protein
MRLAVEPIVLAQLIVLVLGRLCVDPPQVIGRGADLSDRDDGAVAGRETVAQQEPRARR